MYIEHKNSLNYSYDLKQHLQIDFVVVQTFVVVVAFGTILPFIHILRF
jgi:hypothetical protein